MTTHELWHTDDGTPVYSTCEIHQPYVMIEASETGLLVIELEDYRALAALFEEAVALLCDVQNRIVDYVEEGDPNPKRLALRVSHFLATQDVFV